MASKPLCARCVKSTSTPQNFLLVCTACKYAWHHRCHRPVVTDQELIQRIRAINLGDHSNGIAGWRCNACVTRKAKARALNIHANPGDSDKTPASTPAPSPLGLGQLQGTLPLPKPLLLPNSSARDPDGDVIMIDDDDNESVIQVDPPSSVKNKRVKTSGLFAKSTYNMTGKVALPNSAKSTHFRSHTNANSEVMVIDLVDDDDDDVQSAPTNHATSSQAQRRPVQRPLRIFHTPIVVEASEPSPPLSFLHPPIHTGGVLDLTLTSDDEIRPNTRAASVLSISSSVQILSDPEDRASIRELTPAPPSLLRHGYPTPALSSPGVVEQAPPQSSNAVHSTLALPSNPAPAQSPLCTPFPHLPIKSQSPPPPNLALLSPKPTVQLIPTWMHPRHSADEWDRRAKTHRDNSRPRRSRKGVAIGIGDLTCGYNERGAFCFVDSVWLKQRQEGWRKEKEKKRKT